MSADAADVKYDGIHDSFHEPSRHGYIKYDGWLRNNRTPEAWPVWSCLPCVGPTP